MAQRFYLPIEQVFTDLGAVGAGYRLNFFETNTTTRKDTYSDTALSVANTNPVIADSAGRFGDIFVDNLADYKVVLEDANENTVWTADPSDPNTFSLNDFDPRPASFWGTTAGTSSAYTLTPDPAIDAYSNTQIFTFACHTDCAASPTIAISGLAALNMKKFNGAGGKVDLEAGDIQGGQRYNATNDGVDIVVQDPFKPYINIDRTIQTDEIIKLTNNTTDADHDMDFSTGANMSSDDTVRIISTSAFTKQIDNTFAVGTDQGGLAAGVTLSADTWYYCFALSTSDGTTVDFGFDDDKDATNLLADAAVIAANLNKFARVGAVRTDSSSNIDPEYSAHTTSFGQVLHFETGEVDSTTNSIPFDDTIPQSSEGAAWNNVDFAPLKSTSTVFIELSLAVSGSALGSTPIAAIFKDSETDAFAADSSVTNADHTDSLYFKKRVQPGTTSVINYKVRFGVAAGGTVTINGTSGTRKFGGVIPSTITITEYI